uniref:Cryptochrome DASH n=1 Tax=Tritonia tetraquetra TaxID=2780533 RepID=A0A2Z4QKW7_9GAST|nr:cryptochrome dash [Tritonia tetraquetra]
MLFHRNISRIFFARRQYISFSSMSSSTRVCIVLFRNDLRLHDNEALFLANKNCSHVLPLYCFDPRHFQGTYHYDLPKTGSHRAKFLLECVTDLKTNLQSRGSDLVVRLGKPENVIPELMANFNLGQDTVVVFQREVTDEEVKVEKGVKENSKLRVETVWGHTLHHVADLPFQPKDLPDVYTEFRKRVEGNTAVRQCFNLPDKFKPLPSSVDTGTLLTLQDLGLSVPETDPKSAFPFNGGETAALERLNNYLWGSDNVSTYKETRNGMIGSDYSTKFSSWLAHGCISPRKIYWEIKKYEQERTANQSTYWVIFELLWRDYFRYVAMKFGNQLFYSSGIKGGNVHWKKNMQHFKAWQEGKTGVPYVDANMRELAATGFMSNRGRQNVASFLTKDLQLDWRLGAEWFESMLIDHDVCSNYGNWLYSAGIGNDPRENRKFNVVKQGLDYDADGDYIRIWVPELRGLKSGKVHCIWTASKMIHDSAGISLGETYPYPIVMAPEWNRHVNRPTSSGAGTSRGGGAGKGPGSGRGQHSQSSGQKRGMDFYFKNSNPQ